MPPRKPSRLLEDPPSASPSQEHEEEEELEESLVEEESEEELEEEEEADEEEGEGQQEENGSTQKTPQISKLSQMSQNQPGDESSEEEEEEEYETDNDNTKHSPTASSFVVKPAVNKNNHSMEPTNPTTKRALIDAEGRKDSSKRTKVAKDHTQEDKGATPKKGGSTGGRVWNPDDVIAILGGMIDYQKEKGAYPHADMAAFLEFVKDRFGFEVTKTQLYEKVRSLKKKFLANLGKGESFMPIKPLDRECFELSKKIWGAGGVENSGGNGKGRAVANGVDHADHVKGVGNSGGNGKGRVVGNGVDHTEHVKIVDGVSVTKKSAKGRSSEGKRKEKGEKKKKESDKKNKKKSVPKIVEKEAEPVADEDVMQGTENVENVVDKEDEPVTDDDDMTDKEDAVKDDEKVLEKEVEPADVVMKDKEAAVKNDENVVNDTAQNTSSKYPNLIASLSLDMPESRRKLMMEGISLVDSEKARELDDRWKEWRMKEAEFYCKKLELMAEQSRLVMDALKKR